MHRLIKQRCILFYAFDPGRHRQQTCQCRTVHLNFICLIQAIVGSKHIDSGRSILILRV